jgi:hypothetical protein
MFLLNFEKIIKALQITDTIIGHTFTSLRSAAFYMTFINFQQKIIILKIHIFGDF